jgi:hypothetical protein|tara:strand:+ start:1416 stop:1643 length:228 start_codon:yes stop_codon:yes gene_type:complete
MKHFENIQQAVGELNEPEIQNIKFVITQLQEIIDNKKVDEGSLTKIDNVLVTLSVFRTTFVKRLIKLLKRNHMLD